MRRTFATLVLLFAMPSAGAADEPKKTEPPTKPVATAPAAAQQSESAETVIRITVHPMAAPIPALKYQLLPELAEMNQGNPVQGYLKCFMEENAFFFSKESEAEREKWLAMPLAELPLAKIGNYGGSALRQADYAARLNAPDWQVLRQLKTDGPYLLLPDVQEMRLLGRALEVRFRSEVAAGHFDKAIVTAKTMLALSRHLSDHPTLVGNLVGMAVCGSAIEPLEEMIQQPDAPNLYWALSGLPSPLVGISKGLQGERTMFESELAPLETRSPLSDAQVQKSLDRLDELVKLSSGNGKEIRETVETGAKDEVVLAAARKRLGEAGFDAKQLDRFPPLQVLLADEIIAFHRLRDDDMKAMTLPYSQMETVLAANREKHNDPQALGAVSANFFLPTIRVRTVQVRLEQRIALLRSIEALRMYGADHDGHLPERLDNAPAPIPLDPVSGKPFSYRLNGTTATLRGEPAPGKSGSYGSNINAVYEVTMKGGK
ncbi:MAG TPA: hypothetical protein VHX65_05565 [Pirellulales bacterium]|nr:hypothetical protein [Pirellulales bacterium]